MLRRIVLLALMTGASGLLLGCRQKPRPVLSDAEALDLYSSPLAAPEKPLSVYHLGHSLVGRDMPAMLAQLAASGHIYHSQLGWGAALRSHWHHEINGFDEENDHPAARPAGDAIDSGSYDAVVFTEMVEIKAAIKYHSSAKYLHLWTQRARAANPNTRLYLYETWHNTDDEDGWLNRVDEDLNRHWENEILLPAVRVLGQPIHVIPGGQAMAAVVRSVAAHGVVDGVSRLEDFFALAADGSQDTIHLNDLGNYVVAVTHYATLYQANPAGLPTELQRADGSKARAPGPMLTALIHDAVWDVVTSYKKSGVQGAPSQLH